MRYYGEYFNLLKKQESFLKEEIQKIIDTIAKEKKEVPVEHICSRIKSPASIQKKMEKRGLDAGILSAFSALSDLVGIRVVTHFVGDVYEIAGAIEKSEKWDVVRRKDYISAPKPNGYRSYHLILRIPLNHNVVPEIEVEVQLRTIAMDCWAALEHEMKYKRTIKNPELIVAELKRCADEMASTDLSMQTIRDTIREGGQ